MVIMVVGPGEFEHTPIACTDRRCRTACRHYDQITIFFCNFLFNLQCKFVRIGFRQLMQSILKQKSSHD